MIYKDFDKQVQYHLTVERMEASPKENLQKIIDYLITFTGEIEVKKTGDDFATIFYVGTPLTASLSTNIKHDLTDTRISNHITLTCDWNDGVSLNLLKNVTKNIGLRIFDPQTQAYLVNDANLLTLNPNGIDSATKRIFAKYKLNPLFQLNNSYVYFAQNEKGNIFLVNRHLLEYLKDNPQVSIGIGEFAVKIAEHIGHFVALFDKGLIPLSFYDAQSKDWNLLNSTGMNLNKLRQNISAERIDFIYDPGKQAFSQESSTEISLDKGSSLLKNIGVENFLGIKAHPDITYKTENGSLIPKIKVSVFTR